jgi:Flp pilus assembly protein TadG
MLTGWRAAARARFEAAGARVAGFLREECGAGTIYALLWALVCLVLAGVAVDTTNAWRMRQLLVQTADVAAHAGAVALARGQSGADARAAAIAAVQFNMPTARYGDLFDEVDDDVVLLAYDPETNAVSSSGAANAVAVTLHLSRANDNPVGTFFLRLLSLTSADGAGFDSWNIAATGVAAAAETLACDSPDGIFARGGITLTAQNTVGPGYCIHSQRDVWLPQQNIFYDGSRLSMPDLADCGSKCFDRANPGVEAAKFETTMVLPELGAMVGAAAASFSADDGNAVLTAFFADKGIDGDLSPLDAVVGATGGLARGDVVELTRAEFEALDRVPRGLTYVVGCTGKGKGKSSALTIGGYGGDDIEDVAIVTDCALHFDVDSAVTNSLIVSTREESNATITAASGARVGNGSGGCGSGEKTLVMAMGDMRVPADFAGANVAFMVDGDVNFAAASKGKKSAVAHFGMSVHASGDVHVAAQHDFVACAEPPSPLMPELLVIRHVVPSSGP